MRGGVEEGATSLERRRSRPHEDRVVGVGVDPGQAIGGLERLGKSLLGRPDRGDVRRQKLQLVSSLLPTPAARASAGRWAAMREERPHRRRRGRRHASGCRGLRCRTDRRRPRRPSRTGRLGQLDLRGPGRQAIAASAIPASGALLHALEAARGAQPAGRQRPGSTWWRAMNERLLREAAKRSDGAGGSGAPSADRSSSGSRSSTGRRRKLVPRTQREHRRRLPRAPRSRRGSEPDRAVLPQRRPLRVLYAHALVAAPRLALGSSPGAPSSATHAGDGERSCRSGACSRIDIRRGPARAGPPIEHNLGRVLDYAVIQPRLRASTTGRPESSTDPSFPTSSSTAVLHTPGHRTTEPGSRHDSRSPRER